MYKPKHIIRTLRTILHEEGFYKLLSHLLFSYRQFLMYENDLDQTTIAHQPENTTLEVIDTPELFDEILRRGFIFEGYHMNIPECKERLASGAKLFCVFVNSQLAHGTWVAENKYASSEFHPIPVNDGETAYVGGTFTVPRHRRKGINIYIHSVVFQYLRSRQLRKALIAIDKKNVAAQNSQCKLGSKLVGTGYYLRVLILRVRWIRKK